MSSFWQNVVIGCTGSWKMTFPMQPATKISSKWHFCANVCNTQHGLCTWFALYCGLLWLRINQIYPYPSGSFHWHYGAIIRLPQGQWTNPEVNGYITRINRSLWYNYTNTKHYCDVIMGAMASQITSPTIVYSTVYSGADQRKHQSCASLAFVRGIHR